MCLTLGESRAQTLKHSSIQTVSATSSVLHDSCFWSFPYTNLCKTVWPMLRDDPSAWCIPTSKHSFNHLCSISTHFLQQIFFMGSQEEVSLNNFHNYIDLSKRLKPCDTFSSGLHVPRGMMCLPFETLINAIVFDKYQLSILCLNYQTFIISIIYAKYQQSLLVVPQFIILRFPYINLITTMWTYAPETKMISGPWCVLRKLWITNLFRLFCWIANKFLSVTHDKKILEHCP